MTCWASTSSAPSRSGSESSAFSAIASRAAWHSSISKRLAGTKSAWLGSSSRWLARPIRCTIRDAPFGEASWITRSTSPQSMPRSSVEVQTTALQRPARHRRLHLAALLGRERAVVQGDRQVVLVELPQLLERELRLEPRVDEDQRDPRPLDRLVDLRHRMLGGVAGPWHAAFGEQHVDHRRRAGRAAHQVDVVFGRRRQPAADHVRVVDGGGEPDTAQPRRELLQPRQAERQEVAALRGPGGVHLVDDHASEVLEIQPRALPGAEQRQLLGRGQQHVGRLDALALAAGLTGVAGAALGLDGSPISAIGAIRLRSTSTASAFSGER